MSAQSPHKGDYPFIACVIPAAGVGKRMKAAHPKQYLAIGNKTILQHTVEAMQRLSFVQKTVIAISPQDEYFPSIELSGDITVAQGGAERVDSVLSGLQALGDIKDAWVLVHDAARPNVTLSDVQQLVDSCLAAGEGGILATPVRDTMKRGNEHIDSTEPRENLWHALTPQFFPLQQLTQALEKGLSVKAQITDEASAIEQMGLPVRLVEGRADNIKITRPEDLALATFYLNQTNQPNQK